MRLQDKVNHILTNDRLSDYVKTMDIEDLIEEFAQILIAEVTLTEHSLPIYKIVSF